MGLNHLKQYLNFEVAYSMHPLYTCQTGFKSLAALNPHISLCVKMGNELFFTGEYWIKIQPGFCCGHGRALLPKASGQES